jgi:hypothetical protein
MSNMQLASGKFLTDEEQAAIDKFRSLPHPEMPFMNDGEGNDVNVPRMIDEIQRETTLGMELLSALLEMKG